MIEIIVSAIIVILVAVWYRFYLTPKRGLQRYKQIFEKLGYKVYMQKFSFMGVAWKILSKKCEEEHKDAFYPDKYIYPNFDVALSNAGATMLINFINPELIKEFLSAEALVKLPKAKLLIAGLKFAFGQGTVFSEGQSWKNKRRVISKLFTYNLLTKNIPKIAQISSRWINEYDEKNKFGQNKVKYDILSMCTKIFCGVIIKCFFGSEAVNQKIEGKCFEDFIMAFAEDAIKASLSPVSLLFGQNAFKYELSKKIKELKKHSLIFRQIAQQIGMKRKKEVQNAEKVEEITEIVQAFVYDKMANPTGYQLSDEELIDQFASFILAGTDLTSHFFTMLMYYMARYPQIQQKMRRQVDEFIKSEEDIVYQNLKKLTYIDWIQNQVTRHYGPSNGNFVRVATEDYVMKDIPITKGTCANIDTLANHYNPKYFKDPSVFRPERWESECDKLPPYVFLGFSAGPKVCPGKQMALLETKITLVKLALKYSKFSLEKEDLKLHFEFIYGPEPFQIVFQTRKRP